MTHSKRLKPSIKQGREEGFKCKKCGKMTNPTPRPKDKLCWWCKKGLKVGSLLVLLLFLFGCSHKASGPTGNNEGIMTLYTIEYAEKLGLKNVRVSFENKRPKGFPYANGWVKWWHPKTLGPKYNMIFYYRPWVLDDGNLPSFRALASHEVCHLSGIWSEEIAEICSKEIR